MGPGRAGAANRARHGNLDDVVQLGEDWYGEGLHLVDADARLCGHLLDSGPGTDPRLNLAGAQSAVHRPPSLPTPCGRGLAV